MKKNSQPLARRIAEIAPFHVMELLARARALEDLKPQRAFVVAPVRERYPLAERVQALPVLECSRVFE